MSATSRPPDRRTAHLPDDLPLLRRSAVRLVVVDARGRVLLFHTHDPDHPMLGQWWELPGGGIDAGETYLEAAVRELREETGIVIEPSQVGPPAWRRSASFRHRQVRHVQDEVVVAVRLSVAGPAVDESRRLDYEREDYFAFRWWPVPEIAAARMQAAAETGAARDGSAGETSAARDGPAAETSAVQDGSAGETGAVQDRAAIESAAARGQRSAARFYPGRLPEFIGPFLAGEEIDEPFELWS